MSQPLPKEIYGTISGMVDAQMVQRVFSGFSTAINEGAETVHLLVQSSGGYVGDGVALYNFLRNLPIKLIVYNGGTIYSIAVIVFLAAKERRASETATFGIHKSHGSNTTQGTSEQLRLMAESLRIDDERTERILRQHLKLTPEQWDAHGRGDLTITAKESVPLGLIQAIDDFKLPLGHKIYNL